MLASCSCRARGSDAAHVTCSRHVLASHMLNMLTSCSRSKQAGINRVGEQGKQPRSPVGLSLFYASGPLGPCAIDHPTNSLCDLRVRPLALTSRLGMCSFAEPYCSASSWQNSANESASSPSSSPARAPRTHTHAVTALRDPQELCLRFAALLLRGHVHVRRCHTHASCSSVCRVSRGRIRLCGCACGGECSVHTTRPSQKL